METIFLVILIVLLIAALASGYPVAFALPGSAIITIGLAALLGEVFEGDVGAYFSQGDPIQWFKAAVTNFRGIYFEVERDTLIAIPLFVFMGIMLQRSKVAEDLLIAMAQLFGPIPGGLGIAVVFVGALLAATTGIVGATVIAMGLISLPVMLRNNYSSSLATGTIAASGTLGQIIPPSIVLIILADQLSSATDRAGSLRSAEFKVATGSSNLPSVFEPTSTSAGEMFLGALLPGLVLVGLYMVYILITALIRPKVAPPVTFEGKYDFKFIRHVALVLVPPLVLIFAVLGSIILGVATVNQAGAIGAVGAMIMAGYRLKAGEKGAFTPAILAIISVAVLAWLLNNHDINVKNITGREDVVFIVAALLASLVFVTSLVWSGWRTHKIEGTLNYVMIETAKTTSLVFIILLGAAMLTAAFRAFGGEELVREFLTGLPGGFVTKFVVVMAVIFILGFFLDFIEIAVVVVPIIAPILLADTSANVTGVWLGVMIGVNMQTSFLTPPFGFALFYLRGVAPKIVKTIQMYKGVVPFIILQLIGLAIVGIFPPLVNYLPNRVNLTSETAPPPRNPRISACVEEGLFKVYDRDGETISGAIVKVKDIDLSFLPDKQRTVLQESFQAADKTFSLVQIVKAAKKELDAFVPGYRPLHQQVRVLQAKVRRIGEEINETKIEVRRLTRDGIASTIITSKKGRIEALKVEQAALTSQIPQQWKEMRKRYLNLAKAEGNARRKYRRNVDDAYDVIPGILKVISDVEKLAVLESSIKSLNEVITNNSGEKTQNAIRKVEKAIGKVAGSSAIKNRISRVRRSLRGQKPNPKKAFAELNKGSQIFASEVAWRKRAKREIEPQLKAYDEAIKFNIGLRQQDRLTSDQASEVAACQSVHKDISLSF